MGFIKSKEEKLINAILDNKVKTVKTILNSKNEILINKKIHEKNAIHYAAKSKNETILKLLIDYANENNIILDINNCSLSLYIKKNKYESIKLLIDYANENNIILDFNRKEDGFEDNPISIAIKNNYTKIVDLIMEYVNDKNIALDFNQYNYKGFPLEFAIKNNNKEIISLLLEHANKNNIILNNLYLFLNYAFERRNVEIIKLLMEYVKKNNIVSKNDFPVCYMAIHNEVEMVKLFMEYADKHNISLDFSKNNTLLFSLINNHFEMIELLREYAIEHDIGVNVGDPVYDLVKKNNNRILEIMMSCTHKDKNFLNINENSKGKNPFIYAVLHNQIETVKLLVHYSFKNNIMLYLKEEDIPNISKLNWDMLKLLYKYDDRNIVNITYKPHGKLYKIFKVIGKSRDDSSSTTSFSSLSYIEEYNIDNNRNGLPSYEEVIKQDKLIH